MLIENDKHKRLHSLGPADCKWGGKEDAVASVVVTRQTISDEQMQVSVPVFINDTRQDLDDRVGMLLSIVQDRIDDAAKAWEEAAERNQSEELKAKREEALAKAKGK